MAETALRLDRSRWDVQVLSLKGDGPWGERLRAGGIPVSLLAGRGPWDARTVGRAVGFFRRNSFDIIHAHLLWAGVVAAVFKGRAKLVWHEHDTDEGMPAWKRVLERPFLGRADAVIAVSQPVASCVRRRHPSLTVPIHLFPNAVDASVFSGGGDAGNRLKRRARLWPGAERAAWIGYVGRLENPKKGIDVLLEAAAELRMRRPDARIVIAGDGPSRRELERAALEKGLKDMVRFLGVCEDPGSLYPLLDIFVLPSRWEGFGVVLLEAMASGLPVVATRVGGIIDVVREGATGILVPPEDAGSLRNGLLTLLEDPSAAGRMGACGRERVAAEFDFAVYLRKLERFYEKCVD